MTRVVCIKASELRDKHDVCDVREWLNNSDHVYVGRQQRIFVHTARIADPTTKLPNGAYIDRKNCVVERFVLPESLWHNPFPIDKKQPRDAEHRRVVAKFEQYLRARLEKEPDLRNQLRRLRGKALGCWCLPPLPCHAHVLARLANEIDEQS